jgi:hypothetical protein
MSKARNRGKCSDCGEEIQIRAKYAELIKGRDAVVFANKAAAQIARGQRPVIRG